MFASSLCGPFHAMGRTDLESFPSIMPSWHWLEKSKVTWTKKREREDYPIQVFSLCYKLVIHPSALAFIINWNMFPN